MHLAQGRGDELDVGMALDDAVDQREEGVGVEARLAGDLRPGDAQALLKVFFVADQGIEMAGDAVDDLLAVLGAADGRPELGAVVEVERRDGARRPWRPACPR